MWNLKDPVNMVLALFVVVVGAALERFLTNRPLAPARYFIKRWHRRLFYCSSLIILLSQVVRFFFGATAHLNETYVLKAGQLKYWDTHLWFFKDMIFLIIFGVILVKVALSKDSLEFIRWLAWFSVADIAWCIIEWMIRNSIWSEWWLLIGTIQFLTTVGLWRLVRTKPAYDFQALLVLATVYLILCGCDLQKIISETRLPAPTMHLTE